MTFFEAKKNYNNIKSLDFRAVETDSQPVAARRGGRRWKFDYLHVFLYRRANGYQENMENGYQYGIDIQIMYAIDLSCLPALLIKGTLLQKMFFLRTSANTFFKK